MKHLLTLLIIVTLSCQISVWHKNRGYPKVVYVSWDRGVWPDPLNDVISQSLTEFPCRTLREGPRGNIKLILNSETTKACERIALDQANYSGLAEHCGTHWDVLLGSDSPRFQPKKFRILVLHELGHTLGLPHDLNTGSIMNKSVLSFVDQNPSITSEQRGILCR